MLHNPYITPEEPELQNALRFQTYLSGEDKALLMSIRPMRGTAQAIINNLVKNICNDLRDLGITSFRPDADDILGVLVESRPLTTEQINRLRCTTLGTSQEIPTRLQQSRGRTEVREGATDPEVSPHYTTGKTSRRVKPNGEKVTKGKKTPKA